MKKLITVRQALEDPAWLGSMLGGKSFAVMRTLLIAAMGEALTTAEMETFTELTGRAVTPSAPAEELWIVAGRRSGKTRAIGTLAAYLAACVDYRGVLGPGEVARCRSWRPAYCKPNNVIISSVAFSRTSLGSPRS